MCTQTVDFRTSPLPYGVEKGQYDFLIFKFIFYYGFTWDDPVNEETPNSTQANFKGFPGTDGLTSPPNERLC